MPTRKETVQIQDEKGFQYEVQIEHTPHFGFSTAYYYGAIIGQVELGRMLLLEPQSDDDREWEQYEERFSEWMDDVKSNLIPIAQSYFNTKY